MWRGVDDVYAIQLQLEPAAVTGRCSRTGFQEDTHTHTGIVPPPGLLSSTTKGNGERGYLGGRRKEEERGLSSIRLLQVQ